MIPAIGNPASVSTYSTNDGVLRGQLARYEKELSACLNCSTARTTESRQRIQEISRQIEQIKIRIQQANQAPITHRAETEIADSASGLNAAAKTGSDASDSVARQQDHIGSLIDVVV